MADILQFRARSTASARAKDRPCEIVIFPGVRYERTDNGQGTAKAAKQADGQRRRRAKSAG